MEQEPLPLKEKATLAGARMQRLATTRLLRIMTTVLVCNWTSAACAVETALPMELAIVMVTPWMLVASATAQGIFTSVAVQTSPPVTVIATATKMTFLAIVEGIVRRILIRMVFAIPLTCALTWTPATLETNRTRHVNIAVVQGERGLLLVWC